MRMAASAVCHSARLFAQMPTWSPAPMPSSMRNEAKRRAPAPNCPQVIGTQRPPDRVYIEGMSARPRTCESR